MPGRISTSHPASPTSTPTPVVDKAKGVARSIDFAASGSPLPTLPLSRNTSGDDVETMRLPMESLLLGNTSSLTPPAQQSDERKSIVTLNNVMASALALQSSDTTRMVREDEEEDTEMPDELMAEISRSPTLSRMLEEDIEKDTHEFMDRYTDHMDPTSITVATGSSSNSGRIPYNQSKNNHSPKQGSPLRCTQTSDNIVGTAGSSSIHGDGEGSEDMLTGRESRGGLQMTNRNQSVSSGSSALPPDQHLNEEDDWEDSDNQSNAKTSLLAAAISKSFNEKSSTQNYSRRTGTEHTRATGTTSFREIVESKDQDCTSSESVESSLSTDLTRVWSRVESNNDNSPPTSSSAVSRGFRSIRRKFSAWSYNSAVGNETWKPGSSSSSSSFSSSNNSRSSSRQVTSSPRTSSSEPRSSRRVQFAGEENSRPSFLNGSASSKWHTSSSTNSNSSSPSASSSRKCSHRNLFTSTYRSTIFSSLNRGSSVAPAQTDTPTDMEEEETEQDEWVDMSGEQDDDVPEAGVEMAEEVSKDQDKGKGKGKERAL